MNDQIDRLLAKLDKVQAKSCGTRWQAVCPAHDDTHPSLSIKLSNDDKILLKCWCGCSAAEIVASIGLELTDLFPPNPEYQHQKPDKRPFPAADILRAVAHEALVAALYASDLANGKTLSTAGCERLRQAAVRLLSAADAGGARL